jgi:hypothetical protein
MCRPDGGEQKFALARYGLQEFAPQHAAAFDELLAELRVTEEWRYVEREVEIRVCRDGG